MAPVTMTNPSKMSIKAARSDITSGSVSAVDYVVKVMKAVPRQHRRARVRNPEKQGRLAF
jgi:hypothetical protein